MGSDNNGVFELIQAMGERRTQASKSEGLGRAQDSAKAISKIVMQTLNREETSDEHQRKDVPQEKERAGCWKCSSLDRTGSYLVHARCWVQSPVPHKPDVVEHTYNSSPPEVEAERTEAHHCHLLHSKFKASLGYIRPCLQKKRPGRGCGGTHL